MKLNDAGYMVNKWWYELKNKYRSINLHGRIIMPNHLHGIIEIEHASAVGADLCVRPHDRQKGGHTGPPLPAMVQWFKTMTTNEYIRCVKHNNWRQFHQRLWQRNYYEHIIRSEEAYLQISEYIQTNPLKWLEDTYYAPNDIHDESHRGEPCVRPLGYGHNKTFQG